MTPTSGRYCPVCAAANPVPLFHKDGFDMVRCTACDFVYVGADPASIDQNALALFLVSQMYGLVVLSKGGASSATLERVVATALSALGR